MADLHTSHILNFANWIRDRDKKKEDWMLMLMQGEGVQGITTSIQYRFKERNPIIVPL